MKPVALILSLFATAIAAANPFDAITNAAKGILGNNPQQGNQASDVVSSAGQMLKGVAGIGPEEEANIGDSVALEIVSKYGGLTRDPATLRRVNLVGRTLARYSDRPNLAWRFGVLNSDTVNAFSAPDGWVFITRGLYNIAKNDDALAGILGHEICHVTGRHALKIVEGTNFVSGLAGVAAATNKNLGQANAQLQQFDLGIGKIASSILEKGFSPETEYEADKNGHNLARLSGYAGGGLRSVLVFLERHNGAAQKAFSTHPALPERISRLPDEPAPRL